MNNDTERTPTVLEKMENEWVCQLPDGRTITIRLEMIDESDDFDYVDETIEITFWTDEEQLGNNQDFFEFTRNGYVASIENQAYLFRNIYIPSELKGTGLSQTAIEFFKECTCDAHIYARNPNGPKFDDGSELLEPGRRFVERMQALGLIDPYSL